MAKADDRPTGQLARLIVARAVAAGRPRKEPVTFKSAARQVPPPPHVKAEESTA
jgi:hypothetical protein